MKTGSAHAPALVRGVEILRWLEAAPGSALDRIARELPYPKPSIHRLLGTLAALGLVEKMPGARYRALQVLRSGTGGGQALVELLEGEMAGLVRRTGCTVEYYEGGREGMVLRRQSHPEGEIRVVARPGFVRPWLDELDAVATLALAGAPGAPRLKSMRGYVADGVCERLPWRVVRARVAEARRRGLATDPAYNENGVRRTAAVVFAPGWAGILAVAVPFRFAATPAPAVVEAALMEAVARIRRVFEPGVSDL